MILTIFLLLALCAFIGIVISALGKCPLWVPCLLLAIIELMRALPLGK